MENNVPLHPTENRFIRLPQVCRMVGFRRAMIYKLIGHPDPSLRLPAPVKVGRASAWVEAEVIAWLDAQVARRNAA